MQKFIQSVKDLKLTYDDSTCSSKKLDKEKLSERAVHLLKRVDFYEGFAIVDAKIILKEAERVFNNGYEENII